MERKRVEENRESIDILGMIDGRTSSEVAMEFQTLANHHERIAIAYDKLIKFEVEYDYDDFRTFIITYRWETDEEFSKREAKANKQRETMKRRKEAKEAAERALYNKLKQKFENNRD